MKHIFVTLFSILMMMMPQIVVAGNPGAGQGVSSRQTVPVRKLPRNHKDQGNDVKRNPAQILFCSISMEDGIQPIDTSDVYSYEVWDCDDSYMISSFDNEFDFIEYILNNNTQCIIKFNSTDYLYVGYFDPASGN